jgi:hypothetical protein
MSKHRENPHDRAAEIIAALMHGPRTRADLLDWLGMHHGNLVPLLNQLTAFRRSGVIYRSGLTPRGAEIISLQTKPFEHPDVESPKWMPQGKGRRERKVTLVDGRVMGVHEAVRVTGWNIDTLYLYSNQCKSVPFKKAKTK